MATQPDPYRTLGLAPGATPDEIRAAYRRLAKANHPDSAGEKALPRFLAIQAAYESLLGPRGSDGRRRPGARPTTVRPTPRETWRADPERARGARESRAAGPDGPAAGRRRRPPSDEPKRPTGGRKRPSNKATPGSTTYDAADDEPFEPEWSGGTWYGASSGTYWTLNPKEYADPRKHGPEYQRRARRRMADANPAIDADGTADEQVGPQPESEPWQGWSDERDPRPEGDVREAVGNAPAGRRGAGPDAGTPGGHAGDSTADGLAGAGLGAATALLGDRGRFVGRIGLALVGWPPIGLAIATIAGEMTGCSRFAAGCIEPFGVGTWIAQVAVIVLLLAVPSVAALSAVGTLAALAASVPAAVVLSASGGSREPAASAAILGAVLALAYVAGVVFAIVRRWQNGRVP